jgi:hypothetical protein
MSIPSPHSFSEETKKAWIGSILFHLLLALILLLSRMEQSSNVGGFVEVSLGSLAAAAPSEQATVSKDYRPATSALPPAPVAVKPSQSMKLDLPERKFPVADEVLRLPEPKKLDVSDRSLPRTESATKESIVGEKDFGFGKSLDAEKLTGEGKRGTIGEGEGVPGSSVGLDIGQTIGYSIQWAGGGTRQKMSGDLPKYPEGVNLEAQIRLQAVVAPDGSVKSVYPIQKAHVKFEEASMNEVRFWKFERLSGTLPQVDQTCTITFNFMLK